MNDVRQTWLVAAREIRERGRSRAFLVSLLLMLLAVAAAIALPALLDNGAGTKDVGRPWIGRKADAAGVLRQPLACPSRVGAGRDTTGFAVFMTMHAFGLTGHSA